MRGRAATRVHREVAEQDLSFSQLKTLLLLAEHAGTLSVKEVAERLGISLPTASRAVDPLVRRGLVARARTRSTAG